MRHPAGSLLLSRSTELVADRLSKFYCCRKGVQEPPSMDGASLDDWPLSVPEPLVHSSESTSSAWLA